MQLTGFFCIQQSLLLQKSVDIRIEDDLLRQGRHPPENLAASGKELLIGQKILQPFHQLRLVLLHKLQHRVSQKAVKLVFQLYLLHLAECHITCFQICFPLGHVITQFNHPFHTVLVFAFSEFRWQRYRVTMPFRDIVVKKLKEHSFTAIKTIHLPFHRILLNVEGNLVHFVPIPYNAVVITRLP